MAEEIQEEVQLTEEQQVAYDKINKVETAEDGDDSLPSEGNSDGEERVYANNFKSVEELKKGIDNLNSTLPDYVLDGMNEDALEKHYIELRKEFSSKPKDEENKEDVKEEPKVEEAKEKIGADLWADIDKEYAENGAISEDRYKELNKIGIPDNVIDKYIDGVKAEVEVFTTKVYDVAGGKEQYEEIKAWAEENYTQEELNLITSGSRAEILLKFKAVKADFNELVGSTGNDRVRGGKASSGEKAYANQSEYMMDRRDKRYKTDPKYKAKVLAKFNASSFA